jgi:GNAT superfamily N-acetyltransferase
MALTRPQPIDQSHHSVAFDSGVPVLDDWLKRRARANQVSGASRTYVVCDDQRIVAYYTLASGAVDIKRALGRFRRNMPDPVPVVALGRLAVERTYQNRSLGRALVGDAASRVLQAADLIGIRGILVHAISAEARDFYLAVGFEVSPLDPLTLMATLADIKATLQNASR